MSGNLNAEYEKNSSTMTGKINLSSHPVQNYLLCSSYLIMYTAPVKEFSIAWLISIGKLLPVIITEPTVT